MLELFAALGKFALYVGSFAAAGTALAGLSLDKQLGAARDAQPRLIAAAAGLMLFATLAGALILILRLGGQIDGATLSAIWETPAGPAIVLHVVGAILLFAFRGAGGMYGALRIAGAVCALGSFGVNGHSASIGLLAARRRRLPRMRRQRRPGISPAPARGWQGHAACGAAAAGRSI